MTRLPGLGPKRARRLYDELGIDSLDALRAAAEEQPHPRTEGIRPEGRGEPCWPRVQRRPRRRPAAARGARPGARRRRADRRCAARASGGRAGRARRLGAAHDRQRQGPRRDRHGQRSRAPWPAPRPSLELVESAQDPGEAGVRLRTHTGVQVDLRIVAPDQFGNLLQHFTGSKEHNMALRDAAVRKGLHVSEYGVLDDATGADTALRHRGGGVRAASGMDYIEPELRENRGELEAAAAGTLPELVQRRRPARRPALPHDRLGRDRVDRGDGARRPARPAMSTWPSPTTRRASASATRSPADAPARAGRADPRRRRSTASSCWPAARSTSCPTARSTTTTSCWPSSTG